MALGFGFRVGFLGLLHMDIVRERLEREFGLELISTAPNVEFHVFKGDREIVVHNPAEMPPGGDYDRVEEPVVYATIITPAEYLGAVFELCQSRRGETVDMSYLTPERVEVHYVLPLAEIVFDFFDQLKSRTRGFASLDYEPWGFQEAKLVRVDILLHGEPVDAFSSVVHREKAYVYGKQMVERLKELIPRQLFDVAVQASIGSKVIARETVKAKRKDVLAKCYGGDITRKRKLLETQKKGKERMRRVGKVDVPQEAFIAALRVDESAKAGRRRVTDDGRDLRPHPVLPHALRVLRLQRVRGPRRAEAALPERRCSARPSWPAPAGTARRSAACSWAAARRPRSSRPTCVRCSCTCARSLRRGRGRRGHDRGEPRHRGRGVARGDARGRATTGCRSARSRSIPASSRRSSGCTSRRRCGPPSSAARRAGYRNVSLDLIYGAARRDDRVLGRTRSRRRSRWRRSICPPTR